MGSHSTSHRSKIWSKAFAFAGALLCVLGNAALDAENTKFSLGVSVYGKGAQSQFNESRIAGTQIDSNFGTQFSEYFRGDLGVLAQMETGSARARYFDDQRPRQGFRLRQAAISWTPADWFKVQAGAIDQDRWQLFPLVSKQSFPALVEGLYWRGDTLSLGFEMEQAFLADTSTLQPWGNWPGGSSSFFIERVFVGYQFSNHFSGRVWASHFLFDHLNGTLAHTSRFLGNTVDGNPPYAEQFRYGYQGFEYGAELKAEPTARVHTGLRLSAANNAEASANKNSLTLGGNFGYEIGNNTEIKLTTDIFRTEGDVAPALFSDSSIAYGNRIGYRVGLGMLLRSQGVGIQIDWVDSKVLSTSPLQSDQIYLQAMVTAKYDVL